MDEIIFTYAIFIFLIGLCLGSFYNVVILRSLSNESIVFPPSKCPKCGNKLKPWHNIPVLSYLFLRGKCAFCKEKISIQYPLVELITGILFVITFFKFGLSITTLFFLICISCLLIMTGTDLKEKIVDCNYAIAVIVVSLVYGFFTIGFSGLVNGILGALIGFIIIEAIARLGYLMKKGRAMGEADSYVASALGAIAGYHDIGWVLLYSLVASMFFILPSFWYERYKAKDAVTLFLSSIFFIFMSLQIVLESKLWLTLLFVASGLALAFTVIKNISKTEKLTYLPLVPALTAGFLYYVIFVI